MFGFNNMQLFQQAKSYFFEGEMRLGICSELLKNGPVHLKRLRNTWFWWEQYLPDQGLCPGAVF